MEQSVDEAVVPDVTAISRLRRAWDVMARQKFRPVGQDETGTLLVQPVEMQAMEFVNYRDWRDSVLRANGVEVSKPERKPVATPIATALAEPVTPDGLDAEYVDLARKLGIRSAATLEPELLRILHAEMIPVYDYDKVARYLNYLAEEKQRENGENEGRMFPTRVSWTWCCLREDENRFVEIARPNPVYEAAIPMPVLLTIDKIQEQLPEARFFVSQIEEVADPFLAVTVPGSSKLYVIERWDEPGFRS